MRQDYLASIKDRLDVEAYLRDVLGIADFVEHGDELIHSCPLPDGLHSRGDLKPSASFNKEKLLFNCLTCGVGGDILWLTQRITHCTLGQATQIIEKYTSGVEYSFVSLVDRFRGMFTSDELTRKDWSEFIPSIIDPWIKPSQYFTSRGISEDVQTRMKTGEVVREEMGEHVQRAVIPHFFRGKLLGWSMRKISHNNDKRISKYLHSANLPKRDTLYNWDNVVRDRPLYVVESQMSVLYLMSHGIENCVATFGAAVAPGQIQLLKDFDEVIILPDGDSAGYNSAHSLVRTLSNFTNVDVVRPINGKDAADFINPKEYIEDNSISGLEFLVVTAAFQASRT